MKATELELESAVKSVLESAVESVLESAVESVLKSAVGLEMKMLHPVDCNSSSHNILPRFGRRSQHKTGGGMPWYIY